MTITTRFDPIGKDIFFGADSELTPEGQALALAAFAAEAIAEADAQNKAALGRAVPRQTYVDGSAARSLASVRATSIIVAEFELATDVVQYVWDEVQKHSPVLTGAFKVSQKIYADGAEVAGPVEAVAANPDEIVIVSDVPYARKIEGVPGSKNHSKPQSSQAPGGVYQVVAVLAAARYGNSAKIRFSFRAPISGGLDQWARKHSGKAEGKAKQHREHQKDIRQPAIIISFR